MKRAKEARTGYVYVVEAPNGLYKVGWAKRPEKRLAELQLSSPVRLTLLCSWRCRDANKAEGILHQVFREKRSHGEWYALDLDDIVFLLTRLGLRGLVTGSGLSL